MRKAILLLCCVFAWGGVSAQELSSAPQTFAVATIKPSAPDAETLTQIRGFRFVTQGTTFVDLFKYAYDVHPDQVVGGPAWIRTTKFDVVADPETEKRPTSDQFKAMMRGLLMERFQVRMRSEQKMLSVYALVKASNEPTLKKSSGNAAGIPAVGYDARGELEADNATMADLAKFLQRFVLDRPAVDETGIEGHYDLVLRWTPDSAADREAGGDLQAGVSAPPDLFTAIREQLGLKLKATRAKTDVFVVERIELPTED
ncbi:MAG: TIGR03435 family protein [Acidobacteriaceae bacterium]